jgi:hypothetical protein
MAAADKMKGDRTKNRVTVYYPARRALWKVVDVRMIVAPLTQLPTVGAGIEAGWCAEFSS